MATIATDAEFELIEMRAILSEAHEERDALHERVVALEAELGRVRTAGAIRRKLLADVRESRPWRRGAALRRAGRVERLLAG